LKISSSQLENEGGGERRTISIQQPVISVDRFATMREKTPRLEIAEATIRLKEKELATRLFNVFAEVLRAREGLQQNKVKIEALDQQLKAARRAFDLGQGTITDVRDTEVRHLQSRAEGLRMRSQETSALKEYESIVGESFTEVKLASHWDSSRIVIKNIPSGDDKLNSGYNANPDLIIARQQVRIGELGVTKAKSAWIPNLNLSHTMTDKAGEKNSFTGISISMPVDASGIYGIYTAGSNLVKLQEERRDKERSVSLERDRLETQLETAIIEIEMRMAAIDAAKLSVEANEKSFLGGVRSKTDVLNSIEMLYSIKMDYIGALLEMGGNLLNFKLQQGDSAIQGLKDVEVAILG
jgi:protease secretion system outer membrane protein